MKYLGFYTGTLYDSAAEANECCKQIPDDLLAEYESYSIKLETQRANLKLECLSCRINRLYFGPAIFGEHCCAPLQEEKR